MGELHPHKVAVVGSIPTSGTTTTPHRSGGHAIPVGVIGNTAAFGAVVRGSSPRRGAQQSSPRPHRLVAQDTGLSSREHGFESRWGHHHIHRPKPQIVVVVISRTARRARRRSPRWCNRQHSGLWSRYSRFESSTGSAPTSLLVGTGDCGCSSIGRAGVCQTPGWEFESPHPLHTPP